MRAFADCRVFESRLLAALLGAFASAGCSFADAKVGAPQEACWAGVDGGAQAANGSSYYGAKPGPTSAAPTCAGNTGNACDDCEAAHCCVPRSNCYGDPVCACADQALDGCLGDAETAAAADVATRTSQCWNTFNAAGSVEQARVACQRSWCQTECEVP